MLNRWPPIRPNHSTSLDELTYVSRLLGSDPGLVLHGGGNTSIKDRISDITGEQVDVLYVKGSGTDLATIDSSGFTALRQHRLAQLLKVDRMSDSEMMNELRQARLDAAAPDPSVEALLHALIPARVVLHSHADALLSVMNQNDGRARVEELYGDRVLVLPYVMPGFDLAQLTARMWAESVTPRTDGVVLLQHGLFTFGETAKDAYDLHIEFIHLAEMQAAFSSDRDSVDVDQPGNALDLARFRLDASRIAGRALIAVQSRSSRARDFASSQDVASTATRGPATPDHVIRTKRIPLIGRKLDEYAEEYGDYFHQNRHRRGTELEQLDAAPRVVLDPKWGLVALGDSVRDAEITEDIYLHTIDIIKAAEKQSGYRALPAGDIFDVEYWELEQAKLRRQGTRKRFQGEVAVVTGAASGIGRACAEILLAQGAAVVGLDLSPTVVDRFRNDAWLGIEGDVSDIDHLEDALGKAVRRFGGIDMLIPAAGIFGANTPIATLDDSAWLKSFAVNASAIARLFTLAHPYLCLAPNGGRVVLIATKNIQAPGPGASAYSASKAAAAQLARVAALEWAADGIRVNLVHPDAVFDTGLWTPQLLQERASNYGMSTEDYKRRNLLHLEITSRDVGRAVAELCSTTFRATTGANIPIDGGNERVV